MGPVIQLREREEALPIDRNVPEPPCRLPAGDSRQEFIDWWQPPYTLIAATESRMLEPVIDTMAEIYRLSPARKQMTFAAWLYVRFGGAE